MPLFLTEADVAATLAMPEAIAALEDAFVAQARAAAHNEPRRRFFLPQGVFHHMAAALPQYGVLGTKSYTSFRDGTRFYVQLFSSQTGELLAYLEADRLGQVRTGAATGLAAKYMALRGATVGALFGTGYQAETQAAALVAALPELTELRVYGRNPERRTAFCDRLRERLGIKFTPMEDPEATVTGAQVIVTATSAQNPILAGAWLRPGSFVAGVGANRLTARELDEEVFARAAVVAVDDRAQAERESAELLFAYERRKFGWDSAVALADIIAGKTPGRTSPEAITVFKSLGIALEDIAVAALVYTRAKAEGRGKSL